MLNTTNFLGYKKDDDGNLVIIPEEAIIIERIYDLYLEGHSAYDIARIPWKRKIIKQQLVKILGKHSSVLRNFTKWKVCWWCFTTKNLYCWLFNS